MNFIQNPWIKHAEEKPCKPVVGLFNSFTVQETETRDIFVFIFRSIWQILYLWHTYSQLHNLKFLEATVPPPYLYRLYSLNHNLLMKLPPMKRWNPHFLPTSDNFLLEVNVARWPAGYPAIVKVVSTASAALVCPLSCLNKLWNSSAILAETLKVIHLRHRKVMWALIRN